MQKRIVYAVAAILSFILFYAVIPLNIYDSMFYFLILAGGALTAFFAAAFMFTFGSAKEPENGSNFGYVVVPVVLGIFFISSFIFLYHEGEREDKELLQHGIFTEAIVKDGSSFSTRKADFTHLTLEFKTQDGEKYFTNYSIGKGEFNNFYQGQTIPIVYSPNYPQILKIFRNQSEYQEFMEKRNRLKQ